MSLDIQSKNRDKGNTKSPNLILEHLALTFLHAKHFRSSVINSEIVYFIFLPLFPLGSDKYTIIKKPRDNGRNKGYQCYKTWVFRY